MTWNKFCGLVLISPIFLFALFFILRLFGFCVSNPNTTGECEFIGLAFPWGLIITTPIAIVLFFIGSIFVDKESN